MPLQQPQLFFAQQSSTIRKKNQKRNKWQARREFHERSDPAAEGRLFRADETCKWETGRDERYEHSTEVKGGADESSKVTGDFALKNFSRDSADSPGIYRGFTVDSFQSSAAYNLRGLVPFLLGCPILVLRVPTKPAAATHRDDGSPHSLFRPSRYSEVYSRVHPGYNSTQPFPSYSVSCTRLHCKSRYTHFVLAAGEKQFRLSHIIPEGFCPDRVVLLMREWIAHTPVTTRVIFYRNMYFTLH